MSTGVTVIFGRVRTQIAAPSLASGMSGPPPGGAGAQACADPAPPAHGRGHARGLPKPKPKPKHEPKLLFENKFKGRDFERRIRTFVD
jgi:hypothetical protein